MIIFLKKYLLLLTWLCSCKLGFVPFSLVGALSLLLNVIPSDVDYQGVGPAPAPASAGFVQSCKFSHFSHSRSPFLYSLGCEVSLIFLEEISCSSSVRGVFFFFSLSLWFFFFSRSVYFVCIFCFWFPLSPSVS